ncbi:MAG: hypothetical protein HYX75_00485 [Acidobacteria bacterium]|nr:hypothetical protein [Acidobacteriota bacterium]
MEVRSIAMRVVGSLILCLSADRPADAARGWARAAGGAGTDIYNSVDPTSDGGYIVAGNTISSGAGSMDGWCLKLDSSGNPTWQKTFGGSGADYLYSAQQTSDGGYIVAGSTESSGAGFGDGWCLKLDSSGKPSWKKTYGGSGNDVFRSVRQTSDGGYIVAGYSSSSTVGFDEGWCLKLDSSGNPTWQKVFGGIGTDWFYSIQQTSDGGYVAAGYTDGYGAGNFDAWCLKLDSSGSPTWQYAYGGTSFDTVDSVQQTSDGGYILAGRTESFGAGLQDAWCLKLDSAGKPTWQKTYGGSDLDSVESVQQTSDGGFVVAGYTVSFGDGGRSGWCLKLGTSGKISWQRTYGGVGTEWFHAVQQTSDGGYIAAGYTDTFGEGTPNGFAVKLDGSGEIDSSCGTIVQRSKAVISNSRATRSTIQSTVSDTSATGKTAPNRILNSKAKSILVCPSSDLPDLTGAWWNLKVTGTKVTATLGCAEVGGASAGTFVVKVYLSKGSTPGSGDTLVKTATVASLSAGAVSTINLSATRGAQHKYLVAVIDEDNTIGEGDELNNTVSGKL